MQFLHKIDFRNALEKGKRFLQKRSPALSIPSQPASHATPNHDIALQGMLGGDAAHEALARQFGIPVWDRLPMTAWSKETARKIPYTFAKKHLIIPVDQEKNTIIVAISDPLSLEPLDELRLILEQDVKAVYAAEGLIMQAMHECYDIEEGAASKLIARLGDKGDDRADGDIEVHDLLDDTQEASAIIRLLNLIITEAIQQGASDIHFEPSETTLRVRYRIDGVLQNRHSPAQEYQAQLLTRIKVMAKMDIAEHRLPQDGRMKLRMGGREIDFRVSTVPVAGGERIVLRILDKGNVLVGLDKLGMVPEMLEEFKKLIVLTEGIILVTGPTGSGKTTSLYSVICQLANDESNIMTIEDPVEYKLKGIAQIGVNQKIKLDFATGLRHILRQDPDIIMIGEIRDRETAEIAIQASLTGHLVLSTLHTNDAASTIARLVDMGIEPYLLSSCIVGVLAQRLVRCICPGCREAYHPDISELAILGIDGAEKVPLYRGKGCPQCYGTGYRGRHGIYELLTVGHAIQKQIIRSPDAVEMREVALQQGMITLRKHASILVQKGITTVAEIARVTRENER